MTWQLVSNLGDISIVSLAVTGVNILAGHDGGGLSLSNNNGLSWIADDSGLQGPQQPYPRVFALEVVDSNLTIAGTEEGIYRSTNSGVSWSPSNWANIAYSWVLSLMVNGNIIFAGTDYHGVYFSLDSGITWDTTGSEIYGIDFLSFGVIGGVVFAGTSGGIYRSADTGRSWTAANNGLPGTPYVYAFAVSGASLFAGLDSSVYRSFDSGKTWSMVNSGGGGNAFAISGSRIMVGGNGGFRYSTDNGTTWTPSNTGLNNYLVNSFEVYGSTILASSTDGETDEYMPIPTGVFRSTDNGNSWTEVNANGGSALAISGSTIYSAGGGIYSSIDSGLTWVAVDTIELGLTLSTLVAEGNSFFCRR